MKIRLEAAIAKGRSVTAAGKVADYIPELGKADPKALAVACCDMDGAVIAAGDSDTFISIQSISKVVSLAAALLECGEDKVFSAVGVEPTADPFNSIMRLEMRAPHRPQNPLINSGAIVVLSLLPYKESRSRFEAVLKLARKMCANMSLMPNEAVYLSEKATSDRNRSLAYFLRSTGSLKGDIEDILDTYFHQCAIACTVSDLAVMGATLANDGVNPVSREKVLPRRISLVLRSLMATCGLYDGSGEFALRVGIPAKSGVGGGIMASAPGKMGLGTVGPSLDPKGNSIGGMHVLEDLSEKLGFRVL